MDALQARKAVTDARITALGRDYPLNLLERDMSIIIEDSDREAAAERLSVAGLGLTLLDPKNHTAARIRAGDYDGHAWVQAFARHRLQERERAAMVVDENRTDDDSMWDRAAVTIAAAIRGQSQENQS
jgi:hypothetical protein